MCILFIVVGARSKENDDSLLDGFGFGFESDDKTLIENWISLLTVILYMHCQDVDYCIRILIQRYGRTNRSS